LNVWWGVTFTCLKTVGVVLVYFGHFVNSRHMYYTNLYQIYHRNGPVSKIFEMRFEKFEAVD